MVGGGGFAPWADAHRKQRVSAVLSSVETSDLRNLSDCLPPLESTNPCTKKNPTRSKLFSLLRVGFGGRGCLLPYPVSGAPGRACRYAPKLALWFGTTAPTTTNAKAAPNLVPLLRVFSVRKSCAIRLIL